MATKSDSTLVLLFTLDVRPLLHLPGVQFFPAWAWLFHRDPATVAHVLDVYVRDVPNLFSEKKSPNLPIIFFTCGDSRQVK